MTGRGIICLAFLITAPSSVLAQQGIRSLEPGQRVRINGEIEGHFRAVTDESLIFGNERLSVEAVTQLEVFPLESLTRLEVWTGQRSGSKTGAVIGGFMLGIPSALLAGAMASWCFTCDNSFDPAAAFGGFLLGGAVGAGIGAIIGAGFKSDRWEDVSLDRVGMRFMPQLDGGLALGDATEDLGASQPAPEATPAGIGPAPPLPNPTDSLKTAYQQADAGTNSTKTCQRTRLVPVAQLGRATAS